MLSKIEFFASFCNFDPPQKCRVLRPWRIRVLSKMPQARAGSLCIRTWGSGLGQPTSKRARLACCGLRLGYRPVCDVPLAAFLLKLLLLLTLVVLAKLTFRQSPARTVATFVGGGRCLWVTTLNACVATLASLAASVRWLLVHTHLGLRSWPAHMKACSSGSLRVPPGVPSPGRCVACSLSP